MIERGIANALGVIERRLWPRAPVILIYHRVADPARDVWGITVGPDRFAEQIEALKSVRQVVPLSQLVAAVLDGKQSDRPLAAVTFDDGYHDVFTAARPILHRLDCPATVFLVSGMVGAPREFWWDELAFIFLADHALPAELELRFGRLRRWSLPPGDRGARGMACHQIRRIFRDAPPAGIEASLAELRAWAGVGRPARAQNRAMTALEVRALKDDLLGVGAHTVRHPSLPFLSATDQRAEIAESRAACEALLGAPVTHFAYPFGAYDGRAARLAREAGFASACTTVPSVARGGADRFRLPRIAPGRMDGEALARVLS
jgi:peptidoglycan/xylan/chitin deacetylase (PgdA/CDA1 family)